MNLRKTSHKKLRIDYNIDINYVCGEITSSSIGSCKLHLSYNIKKDGRIIPCEFKRKFWQKLSMLYDFKMSKITASYYYKDFDYEGNKINLRVVKNICFNLTKKEFREYSLEKLLN